MKLAEIPTAAEVLADDVARVAELVGRAADRIAEALPGFRTGHTGSGQGSDTIVERIALAPDEARQALARLEDGERRLPVILDELERLMNVAAGSRLAEDWHTAGRYLEAALVVTADLRGLAERWALPAGRKDRDGTELPAVWCPSCAAHRFLNTKAPGRRFCLFCAGVLREYGTLPNRRLLELRAEGKRLTEAKVRTVLGLRARPAA